MRLFPNLPRVDERINSKDSLMNQPNAPKIPALTPRHWLLIRTGLLQRRNYSAKFIVTSTAVNSPELFRLLGRGVFDKVFSDRFEP